MSQFSRGEVAVLLAMGTVLGATMLIFRGPLWIYPLVGMVPGMIFLAVTADSRETRRRARTGRPAR
ncbi:MAG TPA: hypothetical protein VF520_00150 [Thermoleophilaceae bacterium]|jgi:hypothetical protein